MPGKYSDGWLDGGVIAPDCGGLTGAPQLGQLVLPGGKGLPHCRQRGSNVLDIAGSAFLQPV
jgi:hypothetical protein